MQQRSLSASPKSHSLKERGIAAVKWGYLGVAVRVIIPLAVQIALARILGADSMGLFAMVVLCIGVGSILVEIGLGSALIQSVQLTASDIQFVSIRVLAAGTVVSAIVFAVAPYLAAALGDLRLTTLLRSVSPIYLLISLAVVPGALLRRDLMFRSFQLAQIASYVVGYLFVGVGLALAGAGIWSLVWACLTQAGIASIVLYRLRPIAIYWSVGSTGADIPRFGQRVFFTNLANWCIENLDNLVVGKLFGASALGYYSISYNIVRTPTNHLVTTIQSVLFPVSARAQDTSSGLRCAYTTVFSAVTLLATPVFAGAAVVAPTIVAALFGPTWSGASGVLLPLSLAMVLHAPMALAGPVLAGIGQATVELKIQIVSAALQVAALAIASQISFVAMGWAVLLIYAIRLISITSALAKRIELQMSTLLRCLRGGLFAGCLTAISLCLVDTFFASITALPRLLLDIATGGGTLLIFVTIFPKWAISPELADLILRLTQGCNDESFAVGRFRRSMRAIVAGGSA
jgi:lipopolysaccharide exporter